MEIKYLKNLSEYPKRIQSDLAKIKNLEKEIGFSFPLAFKEFLYLTGEDYDMLLKGGGGMQQNINKLPEINIIANVILNDYNTTIGNVFAFLEHIDQFLFFHINDGDNPPIYRFV